MKSSLFVGVITGLMIWASCSEQPAPGPGPGIKEPERLEQPRTEVPPTEMASRMLQLEHFRNLPKEIEGCSCYFSATEDRFRQGEYLFAAGFDSTAFISVDGGMVKLRLVSTNRKPGTFGDFNHTDVYRSDRYTVTVALEYKGSSGDETWKNSGTLTVEDSGGQRVVERFVGECGC